MPGKWSFQRATLHTLIVALVLSAAVGIWAFVFGDFGETEIKILLTTLSVAFFSFTSLSSAVAQQVRRTRLLWMPAVAASAAGFVLFLPGIWAEWAEEEAYAKAMAIVGIFAFSFAQACLLSLARLSRPMAWVFFAALASIFGLAVVISGMLIFEADDQWLFRLVGVLGILDGCATLAIPVLYKLGYRRLTAASDSDGPGEQIKLVCPRCGNEGTYPVGVIACDQCSLAMRIEILAEGSPAAGEKRTPPQFQLKTLMLVILVASIFLGWMSSRRQYLARQTAVVARLHQQGTRVTFRFGNAVSVQHTSNCPGTLEPDDLAGIARLTSLETIYLQNGSVTDEHLRHIDGMTHLKVLYVPGSKVTDAGLKYVETLRGLQRLGLSSTRVTDAGLVHLARLRKLERLELDHTAITGAGLLRLDHLPRLRILSLKGTRIKESDLGRLRREKPQLNVQI